MLATFCKAVGMLVQLAGDIVVGAFHPSCAMTLSNPPFGMVEFRSYPTVWHPQHEVEYEVSPAVPVISLVKIPACRVLDHEGTMDGAEPPLWHFAHAEMPVSD